MPLISLANLLIIFIQPGLLYQLQINFISVAFRNANVCNPFSWINFLSISWQMLRMRLPYGIWYARVLPSASVLAEGRTKWMMYIPPYPFYSLPANDLVVTTIRTDWNYVNWLWVRIKRPRSHSRMSECGRFYGMVNKLNDIFSFFVSFILFYFSFKRCFQALTHTLLGATFGSPAN